MSSSEKIKLRHSIELFYTQNTSEHKKYQTYQQFKDYKSNGRPIYTKRSLYRLMKTLDERGNLDRKTGSGRPMVLNSGDQAQLKRDVNNKTGLSQRKLGKKYKVDQKTISNSLKRMGIHYRKRKIAPKQTPAQKERQRERLVNFVQNLASEDDQRDLVIDDESYFTLSGSGMPGNSGFYTNDSSKTPNHIKHRQKEKFPEKVMIWVAFSRRGISKIWVAPKHSSMKAPTYIQECLKKRLFKFIDEHYGSRDEIVFWPDLASCHYAKETQQFLTSEGITVVPRDQNPPNAPQIRPIENFFGILKQHVYANNWWTKSRDALIRRIKKCVSEIDMNMVVKMFQNLKPKIKKAEENGLESLI